MLRHDARSASCRQPVAEAGAGSGVPVLRATNGPGHTDCDMRASLSRGSALAQADRGRRRFLQSTLLAALFASNPSLASSPIRIGLTPVFLDNQASFLDAWRAYLDDQLQRPVQFVRRASYAEIIDLLIQDKLDFAWLCGFPFVTHRKEFDLLAVPVYKGRPLYQSYLIVPVRDDRTQGLAGLKGRIFAYSDPNSNSGYLVPQFDLARMNEPADRFFRKTFFTGSHRAVVEAVAKGLADGGAVDGYVYDALARLQPQVVEKTRIVSRSPFFGFPPFVAHKRVERTIFRLMQTVLLTMAENPPGRKLLADLYLDGFVAGDPHQFDEIAAMVNALKRDGRVP